MLENARLYRDLEEREAKIRRLVEANIIGIFIWDLDGRIIEANDAFLRMVGYDHKDIVSGRMLWPELRPPEWRVPDLRRWRPELKMTGSLQPFEKEYFRKDGSRVPVLIGVAITMPVRVQLSPVGSNISQCLAVGHKLTRHQHFNSSSRLHNHLTSLGSLCVGFIGLAGLTWP
jgi:PAS domain S-box-containing protein